SPARFARSINAASPVVSPGAATDDRSIMALRLYDRSIMHHTQVVVTPSVPWIRRILKKENNMYPLKKGKTTTQAHVGLPQGTFEEEHGRKGFYGKSAHLYHAHPPTGWIRFEGKLRPHCFDLNRLKPGDMTDPEGLPAAFLGNNDIRLFVSRRSEPMPFYFRNADGDELYFVHRGRGKIETDFGPLDFEPGDYINLPRAVTYRIVPETRDNF